MAPGALVPALVLVTLVTAAAPAPAHCPVPRLCVLVCKLSPQLATRCDACHPGICERGHPTGNLGDKHC